MQIMMLKTSILLKIRMFGKGSGGRGQSRPKEEPLLAAAQDSLAEEDVRRGTWDERHRCRVAASTRRVQFA